jgi:hypothetical protein
MYDFYIGKIFDDIGNFLLIFVGETLDLGGVDFAVAVCWMLLD